MKGLTLLKNLSKYVDRNMLDLSYKMYVRPRLCLDYEDVIYHNQRVDLMYLIERVQYKAALIVSGCWLGASREKLYDEIGWESLSDRRKAHRLTIFYKIHNGFAPSYLSDHIPKRNDISLNLRNRIDISPLTSTKWYENSFFPFTIEAWKELNEVAKSKSSVQSFKKYLDDSVIIRPAGTLFLEYVTNLGLSYKLKLGLLFQIYAIIGLIINLIVLALFVHAV